MYCMKLTFKAASLDANDEPVVLYGVIESEDDGFLSFRTGKKTYRLSKRCILALEETTIPFRDMRSEP